MLFVFFSIQLMTGATEICDARYIGRHCLAFTLAIPSRSPRSLQVLSSAPKNAPFICGVFFCCKGLENKENANIDILLF